MTSRTYIDKEASYRANVDGRGCLRPARSFQANMQYVPGFGLKKARVALEQPSACLASLKYSMACDRLLVLSRSDC